MVNESRIEQSDQKLIGNSLSRTDGLGVTEMDVELPTDGGESVLGKATANIKSTHMFEFF